ncbi:MAG: hypothetical protein LBB89_02195 [Treponema sp.]|jgi:hypothetical protein|nr:hypothetical protein [Treponema sp.]
MIGFLVKKTFFDVWDNMFRIILLNLGFILSLTIPIIFPGYIPIPALAIVVAAAGFLWCTVYLAAAALSIKAVSDYGVFNFADFWANLKAGWPAGIVLALIGFFFFVAVKIIIPFYLEMNSLAGLLLAAVVFWTLVLALAASQFFFAIRARLDTKPLKIIKKCFIIFFDNPGFSIFTLLYTIVTLVLSIVFAFLLPGPAGALLFLDEALRLRLMKYDWLEANPPAAGSSKRRAIPWDAILIEEREKTGTRTFRNFIFPWKD